MTREEAEELRNAIVRLNALVVSTAESASAIAGSERPVERTQALAELAEEESEKILHHLDSIINSHVVAA